MTCHFIFYNVGLGQCIGVLPHDHHHAIMIDCGHDGEFHPINDFKRYLPNEVDGTRKSLRTLVLTNYDHDHFSGLPYLYDNFYIKAVLMPNNLTMDELLSLKPKYTQALHTLEKIRSSYTVSDDGYVTPYTKCVFYLTQSELKAANIPIETNHLSQMIFIQYGQTTVCIPGDLEDRSWELMLKKPKVCDWLRKTTVFVASHHGRENGYHSGVFDYCKPHCIIMSDKAIMHETQGDMSSVYAKHVNGDGITYIPRTNNPVARKTLTTRNDGNIIMSVPMVGKPNFKAYIEQ